MNIFSILNEASFAAQQTGSGIVRLTGKSFSIVANIESFLKS
jgi:hypothetical protein